MTPHRFACSRPRRPPSWAPVALAGRPNQLSPRHQDWDIIPRASAACRQTRHRAPAPRPEETSSVYPPEPEPQTAAAIIRQRRSAQAFDPEGRLEREAFIGMLDRTLPRKACPPFDVALGPTRISLALFVHRVQDVPSGLYAFIRDPAHLDSLRAATSASFAWEPFSPDGALYLLAAG